MVKETCRFVKDYKNQKALRDSFNQLIEKTFSLNFEAWYQNGFWGDHYVQYSIAESEHIVSSISVMTIEYQVRGKIRHYAQLGGVATDPAYRNQGLSKVLMNHVIEDYQTRVDGLFLFGNDSVLDFYPRFGFRAHTEYCYFKTAEYQQKMTAQRISMNTKKDWEPLIAAVEHSACNGALEMMHNSGLVMFYVMSFMKDMVYYVEDHQAYVIAEIEGEILRPYAVYSQKEVDLDRILTAFGSQIKRAELQFTPLNTTGYQCKVRKEEDCTLFMLGKEFEDFESHKMTFPVISHT